jgi:hypothetical protein
MSESIEASLVRIRTADGHVVGAGFLVGQRQVLTCAHVIVQALNLTNVTLDTPLSSVTLDFPLLAAHTLLTAKVVLWHPPQDDGRGDIAGLELLDDPPAGAQIIRFADADDVWEHRFRAFGFPNRYDDGIWATGRLLGRQATNWIHIEDVKTEGFSVMPGFSGGPVWDEELQGVVGMVVAASSRVETKSAFVIPLDVLVRAWPNIEPDTHTRIFLSAAPGDNAMMERLATDLQARSIVVWTEQHGPGENHSDKEERVRQAIRAAQAVVLVVSSQTRSSSTVKEHVRLADMYKRRLILVWVGDDDHVQSQRYGWQETVWIDARQKPYKAAVDAIEVNLNQHRSIEALLGPAPAISEEEQKEPRNPYKGLRAFTSDDKGDFFGRDRLVGDLVKDVEGLLGSKQPAPKGGRLLTLIGPSGSGKSSVVMAGLLPRLQQGALPGSKAWIYLEPMKPGKYPIEELGLTLTAHFPERTFADIRKDLEDDARRGLHVLSMQLVKQQGGRVVLLVDQFEELFTLTESEGERQRFIDLLVTATTEPRGPLLVLLTLRADFYHCLMQHPDLYRLFQAQQQPLLPMEIDDLRATIEQPAALPDVQLTFDGNLVGDLLFEVGGRAGALPLLQFTLDELYRKRDGHRLTLSAYREIGGVNGALSQHAERTYAALPSDDHRRLARTLFMRLIDPGATEQDTTRRRALLSEFTLHNATQTRLLRDTIDAFVASRLLMTNEVGGTTTIEVSHEAVIREWKDLAEWLHEARARDDIRFQQGFSEDVEEWERRKQPKDRLYRGSQLKEAQDWAKRNMPSKQEEDFLHASNFQRKFTIVRLILVFCLLVFSGGGLAWYVTHLPTIPPDPTLVTNLKDDGSGSLRWCIASARSGSTIKFAPNVRGTIKLISSDISIDKNLTIQGPGASLLAISSTGSIIQVSPRASVTISGLSFKNGTFTNTSFIMSEGTLTVTNSVFSNNQAQRNALAINVGSSITNGGNLVVINSIFSNNFSGLGGGAIDSNSIGKVVVINSTFSNNSSQYYRYFVDTSGLRKERVR